MPVPDAGARQRGAVRSTGLAFGVLLAAVVLVSVNLRPGASSLGPVLEELRTGLGMSAAVAGKRSTSARRPVSDADLSFAPTYSSEAGS